MTDNLLFIITLIIILINITIAHLFAPMGMILSPFVISITSILLVMLTNNVNPIKLMFLILSLLLLNDIGMFFFSGGTLDKVGFGLHNLVLLMNFILSELIIILAYFIKYKDSSIKVRINSILISILIFIIYLAIKSFAGQYFIIEY